MGSIPTLFSKFKKENIMNFKIDSGDVIIKSNVQVATRVISYDNDARLLVEISFPGFDLVMPEKLRFNGEILLGVVESRVFTLDDSRYYSLSKDASYFYQNQPDTIKFKIKMKNDSPFSSLYDASATGNILRLNFSKIRHDTGIPVRFSDI